MAVFEYQALTTGGRAMKGTLEASSLDQARGMLIDEMNLIVNTIEKTTEITSKRPIGRNEFLLFNQQLASLTKAGIPLERGLRELVQDIKSRPMRKLVNDVATELESGSSIEDAFEKHHRSFPVLYGRILKAGVETGRLSEMLTSLNRHLEMGNQTRRIIFEAVCYPAVVLALAAIIMTGIFTMVIPQFGEIFADFGIRLPSLTTFILNLSQEVITFWATVAVIVLLILLLRFVLSTSPAGRRTKEGLFMWVPALGKLYHFSILSRMAEAMALLINAGCDMPTSLRLGAQASGSEKLKAEAEVIASQIEQGSGILEAGQFCAVLPRLFLYSVQLGTQRNELQDNLYSLAQMYTQQALCMQGRLQAILLPIMLGVVGTLVAICVLGLFLPLVTMLSSFS